MKVSAANRYKFSCILPLSRIQKGPFAALRKILLLWEYILGYVVSYSSGINPAMFCTLIIKLSPDNTYIRSSISTFMNAFGHPPVSFCKILYSCFPRIICYLLSYKISAIISIGSLPIASIPCPSPVPQNVTSPAVTIFIVPLSLYFPVPLKM